MFDGTHVWFRFGLAALATWRVTHLLANEDGPANVIVRMRRRLGNGFLGTLADCFNCLSLWVAVPMAFLVGGTTLEWFVGWLALSGAACLLERGVPATASAPVVIQQVETREEGREHGVLRTESREPEDELRGHESAPTNTDARDSDARDSEPGGGDVRSLSERRHRAGARPEDRMAV